MKSFIMRAKKFLVLFLALCIALPAQAWPNFALFDYIKNTKRPEITLPEISVPKLPEVFTDVAKKCVNGLNQIRDGIVKGFNFPTLTIPTVAPPVAPIVETAPSSSVAKPLIFGAITLVAIGWTVKKVFCDEEAANA